MKSGLTTQWCAKIYSSVIDLSGGKKGKAILSAAVSQSYATISLKYVLQNRGVGYNRCAQIIIYVIQGGQLHSE